MGVIIILLAIFLYAYNSITLGGMIFMVIIGVLIVKFRVPFVNPEELQKPNEENESATQSQEVAEANTAQNTTSVAQPLSVEDRSAVETPATPAPQQEEAVKPKKRPKPVVTDNDEWLN